MTVNDRDEFPTRRESDLLLQQVTASTEERLNAHRREHEAEAVALDLAMTHTKLIQDQHNIAHESAHIAHAEKHTAEALAVTTALRADSNERKIHTEAHDREHSSHMREHSLNNLAIDKAESANDKRFSSTNAYREQLNDVIRQLAPKETLEVFIKDVDRRFEESRKDRERRHEELRQAITTLERTDVKAEGRGIGQGAMIAYIVTAISVLGSLIVLVNLLTASTP